LSTVDLFIVFPLDPFSTAIGGAETWLRDFIKNAPDDFNIRFVGFTTNSVERPPRRWTRANLGKTELLFFPLFSRQGENRKPRVPISLTFSLSLAMARIEFSHSVLFFNRIEPALACVWNDNPKVAVVHNDIVKQHTRGVSEVLWSRFPSFYFVLERLLFATISHVLVVSGETLRFYQARYQSLETVFEFVPTWADRDVFYPENKPRSGLRDQMSGRTLAIRQWGTWILFVGRLQEQKNPNRLVDTFVEYLKVNSDAALIIVGDGNLRESTEGLVRLKGLEARVVFLGSIGQDELAKLYRAADVLLLSSNFEGMPMCVIEALACGLPVVTTDVGEVRKLVIPGFSGEISESFNAADLSASLEAVVGNPHRYNAENCASAAAAYTPKKVLSPIYETIRRMYVGRYLGGSSTVASADSMR